MAALVREIKPMLHSMPKIIYGIRHGQAWHNILFEHFGMKAYSDFRDTTLTAYGMQQAAEAKPPPVDVCFVSPSLRTLQTASLMYPNTKKVAIECLKEYPQESETCNQRSSKSFLKSAFPEIDFTDLESEEQDWPNTQKTPARNKQHMLSIIHHYPAARIALVTHSTWLKYYVNNDLRSEPELKHCFAYPLELK